MPTRGQSGGVATATAPYRKASLASCTLPHLPEEFSPLLYRTIGPYKALEKCGKKSFAIIQGEGGFFNPGYSLKALYAERCMQ